MPEAQVAKFPGKLPKGWSDALGYTGGFPLIGIWFDHELPRLVVSDPDTRDYGAYNRRALEALLGDEGLMAWIESYRADLGAVGRPATHHLIVDTELSEAYLVTSEAGRYVVGMQRLNVDPEQLRAEGLRF